MIARCFAALAVLLVLAASMPAFAGENEQADTWQVGVARVDVTPDYPIRLNGFGFRRTESEGVTQRISAKALALGGDDQPPAVLITLDSLGVRLEMVEEVAARLQRKVGLPRERLALSFSHSHTTPKVNGASDNIFSQPIPADHQQRIDRYTRELTDKLEQVALAALADRRRARLSWTVGKVGFARNRRTAGGPVDHDLPVLVVEDLDGRPRAIYVSYACHCVTLSHNMISGDWAGYAQELIERKFPGAVALVSIGAGSDSNPDSGVTGDKVDVAAAQGAQIADEVARLLNAPRRPLQRPLAAELRLIDLPLNEPPTREQLEQLAAKGGPAGYNATTQLQRLERGEALLTKIGYPVQTWRFGDRLAMVFLAGEVCVDYALRLKTELDRDRLWVTAYSNDFCAYIPSERLLREGGYGGGGEIPYFALPSTFRPGLEQLIVDEVRRQLPSLIAGAGTQGVPPMSPEESRQSLRTHERLRVELVASEPVVDDPVAIDFGPDGRLWVAEMPDYTRATEEQFTQHGRVKYLTDKDGDGTYERARVFLEGLRFPTDVKVWRDGVLVCDAPDILWARDTDGDGRADEVRKLFSGFATHNPHARVNSLRLGIDNWLYGSGGLFGGQITSQSGQSVDVAGRDFRLLPDTGQIEPVTGRTQQGRVRDDWDNWFGCDNGTLLRHYPVADQYLRRNPHVAPPTTAVFVPGDADPNRLFPVGELVRFKLSGPAGRPTSVCGLEIYRDDWLGAEFRGNSFVCEPVNQLVHRLVLTPRGVTFSGRRAEEEQQSEFLASTDRWFRPVQVRTGPDGAIWVVDMYRYVIEHPRWIPPETVATLDTFAGSGRGRIYRIVPREGTRRLVPRLDQLAGPRLAELLDQPNGTQRDLIQQLLVWRGDTEAIETLRRVAVHGQHAAGRLQALATLDALQGLNDELLLAALRDRELQVRRHAVRLSERRIEQNTALRDAVWELAEEQSPVLRQQLLYSLGEVRDPGAARLLARLLAESPDDPYLVAAGLSSLREDNLSSVLAELRERTGEKPPRELLEGLLATALKLDDPLPAQSVLQMVLTERAEGHAAWQLDATLRILRVLRSRQLDALLAPDGRERLAAITEHARQLAANPRADRATRLKAISLLASVPGNGWTVLPPLLAAQQPLEFQQAAAAALAERGRSSDDGRPALDHLVDAWAAAGPALRSEIARGMLAHRAGIEHLLGAVESGQLKATELDAATRTQLLERTDDAQRPRAARLLQTQSGHDVAAAIQRFAPLVARPGDVEAGRRVFAKACANCHQLHGQGHAVGPDLAALTNKSPQALLIATLDPNRDVDARYWNYLAVRGDGRVAAGVLLEETANSITLVEAGGKRQVILRDELDELRSTGKSLMPEGMEKDLSPQDLADLFTLLATPAPAPR